MTRQTLNLLANGPIEVIIGLGHVYINDIHGCILHVHSAKAVLMRYDGQTDITVELDQDTAH